MRIPVLVMGVFIFAVGIGARAEAQIIRGAHTMGARLEARRIAVFLASVSAWPRSAELAVSVHKIARIDRFIIRIDRDTDTILIKEFAL
jgi:hypothetical protein